MANYTIRFPGGSAAEIAGKTLADREFCYDETNNRIYVGDGINEIPNLQYIASGGGGAGVPPVVIGGTYTAPPGYHVTARDIAVTATSGIARYYPMRLDAAWEITAVGINVATTVADSLVHVALYDDVGNNMTPGTRIAAPSGAGFSGATTGAKEATGLSITLAAGNYVWVIVGEGGSPVLTGYRIATPFMGTGINNQLANGVEKISAIIPPPTTGQAPSGVNTGTSAYAGAIWLKGIPA